MGQTIVKSVFTGLEGLFLIGSFIGEKVGKGMYKEASEE